MKEECLICKEENKLIQLKIDNKKLIFCFNHLIKLNKLLKELLGESE